MLNKHRMQSMLWSKSNLSFQTVLMKNMECFASEIAASTAQAPAICVTIELEFVFTVVKMGIKEERVTLVRL